MVLKKCILFLLLILGVSGLSAQTHYADWLQTIQTNGGESSFNNVVSDGQHLFLNGTYFLDGQFSGFDLPYGLGANAIIARTDLNGNAHWVTTMHGSGMDGFYDAILDDDNNVVLAGWSTTHDTLFVNGTPVIISGGSYISHGIIMKLSGTDGSLIWFKHFSSEEYKHVNATKLTTDPQNYLYVTGYYNCPFQVDTVAIPYNQTQGDDLFILKLDAAGQTIWGQYITSESDGGYPRIRSVAAGQSAIFYSVEYSKPLMINGNPLPHTGDFYWTGLIKSAMETGDVLAVNTFGSVGNQIIQQIRVDQADNIVAAGYFSSGTGFQVGGIVLSGYGEEDGFIVKTDSNLAVLWAKEMGGAYLDRAFNVQVDPSGYLFIGGGFDCLTDFKYDGTVALLLYQPNSLSNFYVEADENGNFVRATGLYGEDQETILGFNSAVTLPQSDHLDVYCAGNFSGHVYFTQNSMSTSFDGKGYCYQWTLPGAVSTNDMAKSTFTIYPNPVKDHLYIKPAGADVKIQLINTQGVVIHEAEICTGEPLLLKNQLPGIYILRIKGETYESRYKVIIDH
jgi:hypothetical protein